ncbi:unnamed protein product [Adineta steineri]|uniref:Pentapeptide repeat-containing protein n=1 Tax=Adineta steineri TaxID=433720 RepID=A0A815B0X3_9BILA|nr:unnamed protein product [Adineta steineri]CAF1552712.1 unnamed protein product [Adineta steineri]
MPGDTRSEDSRNICHPCILWIKLILSASIPLLITIFTVVTYIQQKDISEQNRQQDLQIASLTREKDIDLAKKQREEDQRLANELHYQNVFQNYIDDITNVLYKHQPNEAMFITEEKRLFYIGRKTIVASRQLNGDHRKQLLKFLLETQLVPNSKTPNITSSLNGADFSNVHYSCFPDDDFANLEINGVYLINSSFRNCFFYSTKFNYSSMNNISFIDSEFRADPNSKGYFLFSGVALNYSNFHNIAMYEVRIVDSKLFHSNFDYARLYDLEFVNTKLAYSNFQNTILRKIHFISTDLSCSNFSSTNMNNVNFTSNMDDMMFGSATSLVNSDFSRCHLANIRIENTNLTGSNLNIDHDENISLSQVVLPNGTWMINSSNLVEDGNGEINCLSSNKPYSVWENSFAGSGEIILALNNEITSDVTSVFNLGKCHFTSGQPQYNSAIVQTISFYKYSLFIDSGEAQFNVSAYFGGRNECKNGSIQIDAGLDEDSWPDHLLSNPCI